VRCLASGCSIHAHFAKASCGSILLALLKVGAVVSIRACRVKIAMASSRPCLETPWHILNNSAPLRNPG